MNVRRRTHRVAVVAIAPVLAALVAPAVARTWSPGPSSALDGLFPSDRWTVADRSQKTGLRVQLPQPPCDERPSDCNDVAVINTLDGFNLQPRLAIPFEADIDPATVSNRSVLLVSLGGRRPMRSVGIDQVVWDPASLTLFAESAELLEQHTRYLFVVTTRIKDLSGRPAVPADPSYSRVLQATLGVSAWTTFTTQSATSTLEMVRRQIARETPGPVEFSTDSGGRAVFPVSGTELAGIAFNRQVGPGRFKTAVVPTTALGLFPGAVAQVAFGSYLSPQYVTAAGVIPRLTTHGGAGSPLVQRRERVHFTLFLPASPRPETGWPVAIFGHGLGDNKNNSPFAVAAALASRGVATVAINVVGHGGGPAGTLVVMLENAPAVTLPAGGRGVDQNGDGEIGDFEGAQALPPHDIIGGRDALQQTVIDLMQLVRQIEAGIDVDGDLEADLDAARVSYFGQSFGGIYGAMLLAVEPAIRVGALNSFGGSIVEAQRLGAFRGLLTLALASRMPPLLNAPGGFEEDLPLRGEPAVVDPAPGALAIQDLIEKMEWVSQAANAASYAVHLRLAPLARGHAKSVLLQFARGDKTVPNPTATAVVRAGRLADRTTLFRNDLAFAADPNLPKDPHAFLTPRLDRPSAVPLAVAAQQQIAAFIASGGTLVVDPDGPGPLFETPIVPPLPEDLGFIP